MPQVNATRNQSTFNYSQVKPFIFNNRFIETKLVNTSSAAALDVNPFIIVAQHTTAGTVVPAVGGENSNLPLIVGIAKYPGGSIPASGQLNINVCTKGTIDPSFITLPSGVTWDTAVSSGGKTLRNYMESIGFHFEAATEHTYLDNQ